jgi:hypothetical protein
VGAWQKWAANPGRWPSREVCYEKCSPEARCLIAAIAMSIGAMVMEISHAEGEEKVVL